MRHDAADNRSNARASRERMIVRQDSYHTERPGPEAAVRLDAAPGRTGGSAAESRNRLYSEKR